MCRYVLYLCIQICVYICMSIYMYVCVCVRMCIYIHTDRWMYMFPQMYTNPDAASLKPASLPGKILPEPQDGSVGVARVYEAKP